MLVALVIIIPFPQPCSTVHMRVSASCLQHQRLTVVCGGRLTSAGRGSGATVHFGRVRRALICFSKLNVTADVVGHHRNHRVGTLEFGKDYLIRYLIFWIGLSEFKQAWMLI